MRSRRFVLVVLGFLLIGMIGVVVAVPYLHRLRYPVGLSRDDLTRALTHAPPEAPSAYLEEDRRVDELGRPGHIRVEADAKTYVEALVKRWNGGEKSPDVTEFEERLARAEYVAVRSPEKLIPEERVAETFDRLVDQWELPSWPHVTISELHALRLLYAPAIYPNAVIRLPDKSIAPRCRPTEALFLLYLLDSNGGIPPEIREQVRDSRFPWRLLRQTRELLSARAYQRINYELYPTPCTARGAIQFLRYKNCRDKYFASHSFSFDAVVNEIFAQLGIPGRDIPQG